MLLLLRGAGVGDALTKFNFLTNLIKMIAIIISSKKYPNAKWWISYLSNSFPLDNRDNCDLVSFNLENISDKLFLNCSCSRLTDFIGWYNDKFTLGTSISAVEFSNVNIVVNSAFAPLSPHPFLIRRIPSPSNDLKTADSPHTNCNLTVLGKTNIPRFSPTSINVGSILSQTYIHPEIIH